MQHLPTVQRALRGAWLLLACWLLAGGLPAAWAQPGAPVRESAVQAAFLYKFGGFVEWPAGAFTHAGDPLVIGVAGNEAVAADLLQIALERAGDVRPGERPTVVRRVADAQDAGRVHVLFVGQMREPRLAETLAAIPGPVLVVTQQEGGLRLGGVLNFTLEDGRVRFAASLPAAEARGLRLSARLLAVAQSVERGR